MGEWANGRVAECGYTPVEAMFSTAVDGWFMAFDNEHAGGFEPPGQCCLPARCGFSSTHHDKPLLQVDPWRKLERVLRVARRGWGS